MEWRLNDDGRTWTRIEEDEEFEAVLAAMHALASENRRHIAAAAALLRDVTFSLQRRAARRGWPLRTRHVH